jgi:pyruvate formate lyase activating enzyme
MVGRGITVKDLVKEIEKDSLFFDESGGGVTFSGGEPLSQPAFLAEALEACRERDIHTVVDTCGFAPRQALERIAPLTDLFLFDLKMMDPGLHKSYTGVPNDLILSNLEWLAGQGFSLIVRVPVIPGINDTAENMEAMGKFLSELSRRPEVDLLPYHSSAREKYRRFGMNYRLNDLSAPSRERMKIIAAYLARFGLTASIGG